MYWPTSVVRSLALPAPLDHEPIIRLRQNRRGNFFITLTKSGLGVWDVRPTVLQSALVRSARSLERWGSNVDVCWAHDGRGIIILTSNSHLLVYQLQPTSKPVYDHPLTSPFPELGGAGEGETLMGWSLRNLGVGFIMGGCESMSAQSHSFSFTLRHPPAVLTVPWPIPLHLLAPPGSHFPPPPMDGGGEDQVECEVLDMSELGWMRPLDAGSGSGNAGNEDEEKVEGATGQAGTERQSMERQKARTPSVPKSFGLHRTAGTPTVHTLVMEDGRVWAMYLARSRREAHIWPIGNQPTLVVDRSTEQPTSTAEQPSTLAEVSNRAVNVAINPRFGQIAIGTEKGRIEIIALPHPHPPRQTHKLDLKHSANLRVSPGAVTSMAWTSDGYALAVGYEHAWAVWTVGGRLNGWGMALAEGDGRGRGGEGFLHGVIDLFWAPGNLELFVLANPTEQLYSIPFAKSATTGIHSPDNTRYAFLQMDDRVLVYRGADQPDMSVINPESDVWQQIKVSSPYMSANWPMRYASLSTDGKLVAIAGRRGFTHYSVASGKWKLFTDPRQEQDFTVRGGMLWFHHVLVVAADVEKTHQIRLYSRDQDLNDSHILHSHGLPAPIMVMSLLDNSLLVYTADNTLYHFLIMPTSDIIKLHMCGSISFAGIVQVPSRVRSLSWLIPDAQKRLGDPTDDLIVATIIFLVDSQLVLLRPRRAGSDEVRYDMQVLADGIESYWTHLHGVGTLENSLWGWDGSRMRVWLDALTIEHGRESEEGEGYERVRESVGIRLDFYPLSILMDKGIIIGIDYEQSSRSLPFSLFKIQTSTHLFLPQFMQYHLESTSLHHALSFAHNYKSIVYFPHALEVLLHSILEDSPASNATPDGPTSASASTATSPYLDKSPVSPTTPSSKHVTHILNSPSPPTSPSQALSCLAISSNSTDSAAIRQEIPAIPANLSIAVEFLDYFPDSLDVVVGCARKTEMERWGVLFAAVGRPRELYDACVQLGKWRSAAGYLLVLHNLEELDDVKDTVALIRHAMQHGEYQLCKELLRFLHSVDDTGATLRDAVDQLGLLSQEQRSSPASHAVESPSVGVGGAASSVSAPTPAVPAPMKATASVPARTPTPHSALSGSESRSSTPLDRSHLPRHLSNTPSVGLGAGVGAGSVPMAPSASASSASSLGTPTHNHGKRHTDRVTSPFQLESPRLVMSPPSPKTVEPGWAGMVPDPLQVQTPE